VANKKYFVECGGIKILMRYLQSQDPLIQRFAGIACWNFAENCTECFLPLFVVIPNPSLLN
jgi:hypothetical protein